MCTSNKTAGVTDTIRNKLVLNTMLGGMEGLWIAPGVDLTLMPEAAVQGAVSGLMPVLSSTMLPNFAQSIAGAAIGSMTSVASSYQLSDLQSFASMMDKAFFDNISYIPGMWAKAGLITQGMLNGTAYGIVAVGNAMGSQDIFWDTYPIYKQV